MISHIYDICYIFFYFVNILNVRLLTNKCIRSCASRKQCTIDVVRNCYFWNQSLYFIHLLMVYLTTLSLTQNI
jgi:hypothetical protein